MWQLGRSHRASRTPQPVADSAVPDGQRGHAPMKPNLDVMEHGERAASLAVRGSLGLDAFDLRILAVLQNQGRIPKVKLAEIVGMSPTPCAARIDRLEKIGLIRGYHADIDFARLAMLTRFRVIVKIRDWTLAKAQGFEAAVDRIPNIVECEAVLGDVDYLMAVLASSISHYQEIIDSLLSAGICDIDYTTYPASKLSKTSAQIPVQRLSSYEEPG